MKIEALHEFHDEEYARQWTQRFKPTQERHQLFEIITEEIERCSQRKRNVLELGIGPGFLANYILRRCENVRYEGLDFSAPMLKIAAESNSDFTEVISFVQADLTAFDWGQKIKTTPHIIVTTWALHDLLGKLPIAKVYEDVYKLLPMGGVFLNGDFIQPMAAKCKYEAGRITVSEHLELLSDAGFHDASCIARYETDVENPTTANNYACFKAIK